MKTRNGFVSNSSSSSFIVIGKQIMVDFIKDYENVYFEGRDRGEGTDYFLLDDEMKDYILTHPLRGWYKYIVSYGQFSTDENYLTKKDFLELLKEVPDDQGFEFINIEKSYHSIDSLSGLKEYYYED